MRRIIILILILTFSPNIFEEIGADDFGFRFIRIKYSSGGGGFGRRSRGGEAWRHDYPTAELNLIEALERTTNIKIHGQP